MGKSISHTIASMGYGWNEEKEAEVVYRRYLTGAIPKELAQEFRTIQQMNQRCKRNTLSFVLSPTIEDGKHLNENHLYLITKTFLRAMKLEEHQGIAFVHRNREHLHIHLYVNRINFEGRAYKDNYIGKRSQQAAEKVALELGLKTVKQIKHDKLNKINVLRAEIKEAHEKVLRQLQPSNFDEYIAYMEKNSIRVIPSINNSSCLQGFRFIYKGHNLKGSEVHRAMSINTIARQMQFEKDMLRNMESEQRIRLCGKWVAVAPKLATIILENRTVRHNTKFVGQKLKI